MKKLYFSLLLIFFYAGVNASDGVPRALFNFAAFYSPSTGPYIETYLNVAGSSVQYIKNENGKFQAKILVTMLFKQNDTIKSAVKYELSSPEIEDTTGADHAFFDLQRIPLSNGNYEMELEIADVSRPEKSVNAKQRINILFDDNFAISGIEPIEKFSKTVTPGTFSKSGFDIIPYLDNFYPDDVNKLAYYTEIYNADKLLGKGEKFIITSNIKTLETRKTFGDHFRQKVETANEVNVLLNEFNIADLPSGNYILEVTVKDKENKELLSSTMFFQRSNSRVAYNLSNLAMLDVKNTFVDAMQPEELREYIRSLEPIATTYEAYFIKTQVNNATPENMKAFFLKFWTDRNALDPASSWDAYNAAVQLVNEQFACTRTKGYKTERGRVYLRYGAPNSRQTETMNSFSFPYEIWHYYTIGNQSNCKFVFMTRDITLECYALIHSNTVGEVYNPGWQKQLYIRDKRVSDGFIDNMDELIHQGIEEREEYFDFRTGDRYNRPY